MRLSRRLAAAASNCCVLEALLGLARCQPTAEEKLAAMGRFPNGKPSQFVSFLFSSLGAAEWPESESSAATDPIFREQAF